MSIFYIWQRDMKLIRKFWIFFLVLLGNIILLLLAFGPAMTRLVPRLPYSGSQAQLQVDYFTFFVPGLVVMVIVQAGLHVGELSYVDRDMGVLEIMFTAPVSRWSICLGKLFSITTITLIITGTLYGGAFLVGFHPYEPIMGSIVIVGLILLAGWGFAGISIATVMQIRETNRWMLMLSAVLPPFMATAGLQYPVSAMPEWVRPIASLNPLNYAVNAARAATLEGRWPSTEALVGLVAFAVLSTLVAMYSINHPRILGT